MCTGDLYNIKVVQGNKFALIFPLKDRVFINGTPIDHDIDATALVGCVVKIGGVEYAPELGTDGVRVIVPATLELGTYDIVITATYYGSPLRAAYFDALTIVEWNEQSDAQQYIQGSPIAMPPAFVIGGALTDAELEQLKQDYREAKAAMEQAAADAQAAKEAFDRKAEMLDDVAKEATSQEIKQLIINEGIEHANEYAAEIREIIGGWDNE